MIIWNDVVLWCCNFGRLHFEPDPATHKRLKLGVIVMKFFDKSCRAQLYGMIHKQTVIAFVTNAKNMAYALNYKKLIRR